MVPIVTQGNLATTYQKLGRLEEALRLRRAVYSGHLKLNGEENEATLRAASNYASTLSDLKRFEEAKSLLRRTIPTARRVLGECNEITLRMRWIYGRALCRDDGATLDYLREAVTTLEDVERTMRRVYGGAHPLLADIEGHLRQSRETLRAREETQARRVSDGAGEPSPGALGARPDARRRGREASAG